MEFIQLSLENTIAAKFAIMVYNVGGMISQFVSDEKISGAVNSEENSHRLQLIN